MKLAALLLCFLLVGCSHASAAPSNADVCAAAKGYVRQSLKAPSTAKFPSCGSLALQEFPPAEPKPDKADTTWNVSGYVDSQNGFGAQLRSNFRLTLTYLGNKQWKLESIGMEQ